MTGKQSAHGLIPDRSIRLKESISDYLAAVKKIPTGFREWSRICKNQDKFRAYFGVTESEWYSYKWQIRNRITDANLLDDLIGLTPREKQDIEKAGEKYRWAVSPYYLSLIDPDSPHDPVRLQSIPSILECEDTSGDLDPMDEAHTSPTTAVTRRYPDRLIVNVTNQCAMYCRHCQRRRNIGEVDKHSSRRDLMEAVEYIRSNPEIRDVLLTGGDALMLNNKSLDWLLTELENIPHVEIKRIGTRTPVTLPYRIDDELCEILSRHMPVYVNTHFNHPLEITPAARDACLKLALSGAALGNQSVLLNGINNDPFVMRKLNQELLRALVRPYYLFHAKSVRGTSHFRTRVEEGFEIMEKLRGFTSGLAVPTYIVNAPGGHGKTPLLPDYMISMGKEKITLRTWENLVFEYDNPLK